MGNFNNVTVVNINTTEFSHNGKTFQTYALISDDGHTSNDYIVFNGQLYIAYEDGVKYPMARPTDYSGSVNIYNSFTDSSYERWVEYDLVFADRPIHFWNGSKSISLGYKNNLLLPKGSLLLRLPNGLKMILLLSIINFTAHEGI